MAPRLNHPLPFLGTCAVLLYLFFQILPDERPRHSVQPDLRSTERRVAERLERQIAAAAATLQRMRVADSLAMLVDVALDRGEALAVGLPQGHGGEARLRAAAAAELAAAGVAEPRVATGIFVVDRFAGRPPEPEPRLRGGLQNIEMYTGRTAIGRPYCIMAESLNLRAEGVVERWLRERASSGGPLLAPCLLYAKHGETGPAIQEWLEGGALRFAELPPDAASMPPAPVVRRAAFGARRAYQVGRTPGRTPGQVSFAGARCLASQRGACAEVVLGVSAATVAHRALLPVIEQTPLAHTWRQLDGSWWNTGAGFGDTELSLLHDLEREFGAARFARFWRSEQDVATAFAAAFDLPLDLWVRRWAQARLGTEPDGPRLPSDTLLLSLLTLALLAGGAVAVGRARQVG